MSVVMGAATNPSGESCPNIVAVAANKDRYVVFTETGFLNNKLILRWQSSGAWQSAVTLCGSGGIVDNTVDLYREPCIIIVSDVLYLVYYFTNDSDIYITKCTDITAPGTAGNWTHISSGTQGAEAILSLTGKKTLRESSVALDSSGNVCVIAESSDNDVYFTEYVSSWSSKVVIHAGASSTARPQLMIDANDYYYLCVEDGADIIFKLCKTAPTTAANWTKYDGTAGADTLFSTNYTTPSMCVDGQSGFGNTVVIVSARNTSTQAIEVVVGNNGSWGSPSTLIAGNAASPFIGRDLSNNFYLIYEDTSADAIKVQKYDGSWATFATIAESGADEATPYTLRYPISDPNLPVLWVDVSNGNLLFDEMSIVSSNVFGFMRPGENAIGGNQLMGVG
jgi:hypothetical protein